jgi:hypothetical protein
MKRPLTYSVHKLAMHRLTLSCTQQWHVRLICNHMEVHLSTKRPRHHSVCHMTTSE